MKKDDRFRSRMGFILACIGSAVGMGNIWRFPNMVSTYGGLTFLIPYVLFVALIGSTGVIEEMALGRLAGPGSGPVGAFGTAMRIRNGREKTGRAIGFIPVLGSLALGIGYTVVMGWIFKYTVMSYDGRLSAMGQDMDVIGGTFGVTADSWGCNAWIVAVILVTFIIMSLGIARGIEKANKFMMPALFILLVVLAVYMATLAGSGDGYKYIFTIQDPSMLVNQKTWIYAFGQAFFSLSIAGNGTVIYGSYLSKDEAIPSSARNVAVFDTLAALLAALVIIPAMATTGEKLSAGGPGLMFIYLINVINGMAGGRIVAIIFFTCVTFAGVSSIINMYETPVAYLQEKFRLSRVLSTALVLVLGCAAALCIQHITSDWMDVVSIYICPLGALLAGIMFFWILPKDRAVSAVEEGNDGKKIFGGFYFLGKYVYCACALIALIAGAALGGIG